MTHSAQPNPEESRPKSRTKIVFDLADELTQQELERFEENSKKAGAASLQDHFLNLTLRLAPEPKAA